MHPQHGVNRCTLTSTYAHTQAHTHCLLTVLQGALDHMVRHAAGSHGHVGYDVKSVIASWAQVIDDVACCVVANNNLILLVV